jgi:hypothetical protein
MSITRAGPISGSSGTRSIGAPPSTKCIGASMCVPLCAPNEYADSVSASPFRMSLRNWNVIGASPSYTGVIAGSRVAVTSIQPFVIGGGATEIAVCRRAVHASILIVASAAMLQPRTMLLRSVVMQPPLIRARGSEAW